MAIAPVLPGITDSPDQLEAVVQAAREAGAAHIWCNVVNLRPGTREHFMESLARDWPEMVPVYEAMYSGSPYGDRKVADGVRAKIDALLALYPESPGIGAGAVVPARGQLAFFA
ncbi:MAG: hypothetical protein ACKVT1_19000 [Dehalococcoidia bacterium]